LQAAGPPGKAATPAAAAALPVFHRCSHHFEVATADDGRCSRTQAATREGATGSMRSTKAGLGERAVELLANGASGACSAMAWAGSGPAFLVMNS
jgi:hypothetical protein